MMRLKTLGLAAAPFTAVALVAPQAPVAAQAAAPLTQVTAHLKSVNTMVASFTQTDRKGRALTGTMTLKRPGKLRFQYQKGVPMLIVADGRKLNMIDYETGRVDDWPIGNSPLGVLLNPNPDLSRIAKVVRNDSQTMLVQARDPRKPEFGTITLGFAKVRSGPSGLLLQGWTVVDAQNNRTTVKLSGQRFNVPVADSAFTFQRPAKRGKA
ncbi:MAG TPA: outer membrane lipoprotein carrier protein LolA [Allosphingosinicella sp.]|nr:outer membrane lipoprotein carrier protein LolA [Allosphingosinicella sp.]